MTLKIVNTTSQDFKPKVNMLVYGNGGVGKTTFSSTSPKPLMADCEGGTKYFGQRGISIPVALISSWSDMKDFLEEAKKPEYETIIIDPLNELMEKLMIFMKTNGGAKNVQADGNPTMAGWGWLKTNLRNYLKVLRDLDKHLLLITHVDESKDDESLIKRPMLMTKLSQEVVNMVDIVAYMTVVKGDDGKVKRILMVEPESDKYVAKDRSGLLGEIIEPDFQKIVDAIVENKQFAWTKKIEKKIEKSKDDFEKDLK